MINSEINRKEIAALVAKVARLGPRDNLLAYYQQEIASMLNFPPDGLSAKILISGIRPGTGSTTTKQLLAKALNIPTHNDAGFYRRVIAQYWEEFVKTIDTQSDPLQAWMEFEEYVLNYPEAIVEYLGATARGPHRDDTLIAFNDAQSQYTQASLDWERVPDRIVRDEIDDETGQSGVWQGKLTALIDVLMNEPFENNLAIPIIRVLLTTNPVTAAKRVAEREKRSNIARFLHKYIPPVRWLNTLLTYTKNENRYQRDWEMFQAMYGVSEADFLRIGHQYGVIQIDTSNLTPEKVVAEILIAISKIQRD